MTDEREYDWVTPSDTRADIRDHVDRLARHDELEVTIPYGQLSINRDGNLWVVDCHGSGGGWCWREHWDKSKLLRFLRQWDDSDFDEIELRYNPADQ